MLLSSPPSQTHLGQIATRSFLPGIAEGTYKYFLSRSAHYFRTSTNSFQIAIPNWTSADGAPAGAASTIWCSEVEYKGSYTQITWNGGTLGSAGTVTVADGTTLVSDAINLSVGLGDVVRFRIGLTNPNFLLWGSCASNTILGDAMMASATAISYSTGDTITQTGGLSLLTQFVPCAIIAQTVSPSIAVVGDSIPAQGQDSASISGDRGYVARSIGSRYGYINFAVSGTQSTSFVAANSTRRMALLRAYCTHVISNYGINDYGTGHVNAATMQTRLQAHWATFSGLPVYHCTLLPNTTDVVDNWTTTANQVLTAEGPDQITTNQYIRTTPSPLAGYFNGNTVVESSLDSRKWVVDGTSFYNTPDGLHPGEGGTSRIVAANVIPTSTFTWP